MSTAMLPVREPLVGDMALSADARVVVLRELRELAYGTGMLHNLVAGVTPVAKDLAFNVLYVAESRVTQLCKLLGLELDSLQARDERYARIRALNNEVRELQQRIGRTGTVEQTTAHLKTVADALEAWWDREGFGHTHELKFLPYGGIEVEFSCHLFGDFQLTGSATPVSDAENRKRWFKSLEDRGFVLTAVAGERDSSLLDCDQTREALAKLFEAAIPSAQIVETSNHSSSRPGRSMLLKSIRVVIRNMQDVINLGGKLTRT